MLALAWTRVKEIMLALALTKVKESMEGFSLDQGKGELCELQPGPG